MGIIKGLLKSAAKLLVIAIMVLGMIIAIATCTTKNENKASKQEETQAAPPVLVPAPTDPRAENLKREVAEQRQKNLDAALAAVNAEPKVKDAAWNNTHDPSLLAGVFDDGSNRDGYAEYLCMVLAEHNLRGGVVRVMDVAKAARDDWKELGKAWCPQ
jgi:hypothetical protein